MMISIIAHFIATLTILPLLSFIIFYLCFYLYTKNKREAMQWAMGLSTFFLIYSVSKTMEQLWSLSLTWLFILIVICLAGTLTFLQYRFSGEIRYDKLVKGTIVLTFLLFLPIHVLLYIWVILSSFTYALFGLS